MTLFSKATGKRRVVALMLFLLPLFGFGQQDIIALGSRREIFVDYYLIEKLNGVQIVLHHPVDRGVVL